ncbi:MAG: choice-of-anchor D domain-containing protein [Myxococcales bacterium]|nr:MAG: choice-of-anchor D domain-containing protein [Myxococcales bacterium]
MTSKRFGFWSVAIGSMMLLASACAGSAGDPEPASDDDAGDLACGCSAGQVCDETGACVTPCAENRDCPAGEFCNAALGICRSRPDPTDGDFDPPFPTDGDGIVGEDEKPEVDGDFDSDLIWETDIEHDSANPWIQTEPRTLDFGAVPLGDSAERTLDILNIGAAALSVTDIFLLSGSEEFILTHPELPLEILAAGRESITVAYRPADRQADTDMLVISSNDPSEPNVGVPLYTAIKELATLRVEPDPIDFGLVRLGRSSLEVALHNDSGVPLVISTLALDGESDAAFSLGGLPARVSEEEPLVVNPVSAFRFQAALNPPELGEYSGTLRIVSNDEAEPSRAVALAATVCEPEIEVEPPALDFWGTDIGETRSETATLSNAGCYPLELRTIELGPATTPDYAFESRPENGTTLNEGESAAIVVRYTPDGEGFDVGAAVVTANDTDEPRVIIPFEGDPTPPDIEVVPPELHFDALSAGGTSVIKTITIRNAALGGLLILHDFILEAEGTVFYKASVPVDQLGPGQSTTMKIGYQPTDTTPDTGALRILSNDPDPEEAETVVPLNGDGVSDNQCPVAEAGTGGNVEPLDTIQLDGSASSDPDGTVTTYLWEVTDKPIGSRAIPLPLNAVKPNLFFDLAGDYTLALRVLDNEGAWSCVNDTVSFSAVPSEKIHIQLIWDTDNSDMDLHLVRPSGALWDGLEHGQPYPVTSGDCFFGTCKHDYEPSGNPVNWGGCGKPSLDIDDQNGYGPENINLNDPCDGDYTVYVHFWNARTAGPTTATLRIYVLGAPRHQETMLFPEEHKLWDVAAIRWINGDATILDHDLPLLDDSHGQ